MLYESPVTTATCSLDGESQAVQSVSSSSPYATCPLTGSLVRNAIVAPNGDRDVVWTSEITIGVVLTAGAGVVDVSIGVVVVASNVVVSNVVAVSASAAKLRGVASNVTTLAPYEPPPAFFPVRDVPGVGRKPGAAA